MLTSFRTFMREGTITWEFPGLVRISILLSSMHSFQSFCIMSAMRGHLHNYVEVLKGTNAQHRDDMGQKFSK